MSVKKGDRVRVKDDYELPSVRGQEGEVVVVGNTGTIFISPDNKELIDKLAPWSGGLVGFQWFELETVDFEKRT